MSNALIIVFSLFLGFTQNGKSKEHYVKLDDNTFELIEYDEDSEIPYNKVVIKGNHVVLIGKEDKITFPIPEKVKKDSLKGFFYVYTKDEDYEQSEIIYRKEKTYDYRSISLYHKEKEYDRMMNENNILYVFLKNCIVFEEGYFYIVQKVEKDKIHYIDCYGEKFVEQRLKDQKLLKIPFGYKGLF